MKRAFKISCDKDIIKRYACARSARLIVTSVAMQYAAPRWRRRAIIMPRAARGAAAIMPLMSAGARHARAMRATPRKECSARYCAMLSPRSVTRLLPVRGGARRAKHMLSCRRGDTAAHHATPMRPCRRRCCRARCCAARSAASLRGSRRRRLYAVLRDEPSTQPSVRPTSSIHLMRESRAVAALSLCERGALRVVTAARCLQCAPCAQEQRRARSATEMRKKSAREAGQTSRPSGTPTQRALRYSRERASPFTPHYADERAPAPRAYARRRYAVTDTLSPLSLSRARCFMRYALCAAVGRYGA